MSAMLIKGGTVVDGTGAAPYRADVRIADGRISEIGADLVAAGETLFDAAGCYCDPGLHRGPHSL